jgi:hypothetical protein
LLSCDFDDVSNISKDSIDAFKIYDYIKTKGEVIETNDVWAADPSGDGISSYLNRVGEMTMNEAIRYYVDYLNAIPVNVLMSVVRSDSYNLLSWFIYGDYDKIFWNILMIEP